MSRYTLGTIKANEEDNRNLVENTIVLRSIPDFIEKDYLVAYGFDHACGYFLQLIYDESESIDYDSLFNHLSGAELAYFLSLFGGNPEHIELAYLDLPF